MSISKSCLGKCVGRIHCLLSLGKPALIVFYHYSVLYYIYKCIPSPRVTVLFSKAEIMNLLGFFCIEFYVKDEQ